jgi:hypothetical protein
VNFRKDVSERPPPQKPIKQGLFKAKQKGLPNLANPMWWEEVVPNAKTPDSINSGVFGFSSHQNKLNLPRIYHIFTSFFKRE